MSWLQNHLFWRWCLFVHTACFLRGVRADGGWGHDLWPAHVRHRLWWSGWDHRARRVWLPHWPVPGRQGVGAARGLLWEVPDGFEPLEQNLPGRAPAYRGEVCLHAAYIEHCGWQPFWSCSYPHRWRFDADTPGSCTRRGWWPWRACMVSGSTCPTWRGARPGGTWRCCTRSSTAPWPAPCRWPWRESPPASERAAAAAATRDLTWWAKGSTWSCVFSLGFLPLTRRRKKSLLFPRRRAFVAAIPFNQELLLPCHQGLVPSLIRVLVLVVWSELLVVCVESVERDAGMVGGVCEVGCGAPLVSWMGCCSLNNDHCGLGALFLK